MGDAHDLGDIGPWDDETWRLLVDDDAFGWIVLDGNGVIRYFNDAISVMLGWPASEAIGSSVFDFVSVTDLEYALAALAELVANDEQEIAAVGLPMVFEVRRSDGTTMPVEVGATSYMDADGEGFIRLRVRDARRDQALHDYLEKLASGVAAHDEILLAGAHLADIALQGGTTAIAERDADGSFRRWRSASLPPEVVAAAEASGWAPVVAWADLPQQDACVVECAELPEPLRTAATDAGFRSAWCEPIRVAGTDEPPAGLVIFRPWQQPPLIGHRALARDMRATLGLAFLARETRDRLVRAAESDSLTGLANRAVAFEQLEEEIKNGPTGVLYVDLDGFKGINDSHGHGAGDDVLVAVAELLRATLGDQATAARIGGDEFLAIVAGGPSVVQLAELAEAVVERLSDPMETASGIVELSATVGVARTPEHGTTPDEVVEAADRALYRGKRAGGRGWAVAYQDG